jgi:hypothetical protein
MARKLTSEDVDELFEASNRQIADLPDSYVVNDGVSGGRGNKKVPTFDRARSPVLPERSEPRIRSLEVCAPLHIRQSPRKRGTCLVAIGMRATFQSA